MRFLLLFIITNSLVVATAAVSTSGAIVIAAPLGVVAVAGLALTIRVVILARPVQRTLSRRDLRRLLDATRTEER